MLEKLQIIQQRFDEVSDLIIQPDIIADQKRYIQLNKEYKDVSVLNEKKHEENTRTCKTSPATSKGSADAFSTLLDLLLSNSTTSCPASLSASTTSCSSQHCYIRLRVVRRHQVLLSAHSATPCTWLPRTL